MFSNPWRYAIAAALIVGLVFLPSRGGMQAQEIGQQGQNDDGQQNDNDGGQKNQKDDGQQGQNNDGQKNQKDDGQQNDKDDGQQNQGVVKAVDAAGTAVTVTMRRDGKDVDRTFDLTKNVPVVIAGKAGGIADLKAGMRVALKLSKDKKTIIGIKEV